jgi:hypothetical protein
MDPIDKQFLKILLSGRTGPMVKGLIKINPYIDAAMMAYPYAEQMARQNMIEHGLPMVPRQRSFGQTFRTNTDGYDPHYYKPQLEERNDDDWDQVQQIAKDRLAALMEVAKKRRAAGGTTADVAKDFATIRKSGQLYNPGDYIRGAGQSTPKRGASIPNTLRLPKT